MTYTNNPTIVLKINDLYAGTALPKKAWASADLKGRPERKESVSKPANMEAGVLSKKA